MRLCQMSRELPSFPLNRIFALCLQLKLLLSVLLALRLFSPKLNWPGGNRTLWCSIVTSQRAKSINLSVSDRRNSADPLAYAWLEGSFMVLEDQSPLCCVPHESSSIGQSTSNQRLTSISVLSFLSQFFFFLGLFLFFSTLTRPVDFPGDWGPLGIHVVPYCSSLSGR